MIDVPPQTPRPFTVNDIRVGTRLYEILVRHAHANPGKTIFYGDLLAQARIHFPDDSEMQRAVPIGIGMKLLFVEAFCKANSYPNLACLAVNRGKGIPGVSYPGDWEFELRQVAAFNWEAVQPMLDAYVEESIVVATPPRRIKEKEARVQLFSHYREHRAAYAPFDNYDREEMVNILMSGVPIERALVMVLDAKAAFA